MLAAKKHFVVVRGATMNKVSANRNMSPNFSCQVSRNCTAAAGRLSVADTLKLTPEKETRPKG